ncbi:uncharacterized protein LOC110462184 [Mizuhopecten yessoensis]|uniref:uncharacterized protein LOC110454314 n=1 Tax=Mizuhopecten yessoensis TaxID=6573 RepID=UPI000B45931A|nr:uncharacterized protein LOC110454314 [Mizuhopecten yessoensis]XP_021371699.1 uncharacterized protein LOC110462184 [Mizuhopecten yessoensis]
MVRSRQKFSSKDAKGVSAITNFFRQTDHTASLCHPEESRTSRTSETPDIDTSDTSSCQPESACMLDSFNCPGSIITTTEVSNIPSASSGFGITSVEATSVCDGSDRDLFKYINRVLSREDIYLLLSCVVFLLRSFKNINWFLV